MDLLVEPSDHKLVIFDIRLHERIQPTNAPASVVPNNNQALCTTSSLHNTQTPRKFNYKALRKPGTAEALTNKLNADLKQRTSNLNISCKDSDALQFTMDNDFQLMSDSITSAATDVLGTVKKAESANKHQSTLPPSLQQSTS